MRWTVIPFIMLVSLCVAPVAWADNEAAIQAIETGNYARAEELLEDAPASDETARLLLADVWLQTGDTARAARLLDALGTDSDASPQARTAYGRYLISRGEWDAAVAVLDPAVEGADEAFGPARYWRALAFHHKGRRSRAQLEWEDFVREYNRGEARDAESLMYVGLACHRLELFADANAAFREALELAPDSLDIRMRWAELFMQKYRPDEAMRLIDEVLERNPNHPEALAAKARAVIDLSYDLEAAEALAQRALQTNPNQAEAREVLASLAIDGRDYQAAATALDDVTERWPRRSETVALRAGVAWLTDDTDTYETLRERAHELDRRPAAFYHTVGELAERHFRYNEAMALYQQSIEADGGFWPAYVSLGIAHSRAGDDGRALSFLRRAFDADPFNVQAFNMVELWETTLTDYRYVEDDEIDGLRYRFHRDERAVLERYIPPAVRAAYQVYAARYAFEPEPPLSIEVFADQATFGIRSVGLPMAPQHGICFGHVVTSRSPREGDFNWRQVIEHELSHVFSLQASNYRVPRWFTEGLAEYDTILSRPEWRRENDMALVQALQQDALLSVLELNRAFVNRERPEQVLEAYFQASLVVEFIGEQWGYDALVDMLHAWADGQPTTEVVASVLEVTVEGLDDAFETMLRDRYARLLPTLEPALWWYRDTEPYAAAVEAHPNDPHALAEMAWAHAASGDLGAARDTANRAIALDERQALAHLLLAHVSYGQGAWDNAATQYQAVLDADAEGVSVYASLGDIALRRGDLTEAAEALEAAVALYDRDPEVHRQLATIYERQGNAEAQRDALARAAMLDEHDAITLRELARLLEANGDMQQAFVFASMAANVDPFHAELHPLLGRLAYDRGAWEVARRELEMALAEGPEQRVPLLRLLLDVYEELALTDEADRLRRELAR